MAHEQSSMAVKTPGNVAWDGMASGLICGMTPRDVTARKLGVSITSLPLSASSPSLASESPSPVVELSLVNADGLEASLELSEADMSGAVEAKLALNSRCLDGEMYTGRVLV